MDGVQNGTEGNEVMHMGGEGYRRGVKVAEIIVIYIHLVDDNRTF